MVHVYTNRGASGIDGLPSTALGVQLSTNQPTLLVLGDLSIMHDFGVLFTLHNMTLYQPFVIVIINNFGGNFGMLPIAKEHDVFDTHFTTVHTHGCPVTEAINIETFSVDTVSNLTLL